MIHSLILQLPVTGSWGTKAELSLRHQLEAEIQAQLGESGHVDGGDIGSGNMNIFVEKVKDPAAALEQLKTLLTGHGLLDKAIIQLTTRETKDDDHPSAQVLWPQDFKGVFSLF